MVGFIGEQWALGWIKTFTNNGTIWKLIRIVERLPIEMSLLEVQSGWNFTIHFECNEDAHGNVLGCEAVGVRSAK